MLDLLIRKLLIMMYQAHGKSDPLIYLGTRQKSVGMLVEVVGWKYIIILITPWKRGVWLLPIFFDNHINDVFTDGNIKYVGRSVTL
jgi:hypothetical protein